MIELWVERVGDDGATAHGWVRHRVAPLLGREPDEVPLHVDDDGGLSLLATDLHVSLSHHEAWRALAVSTNGAVGVDVLTVPEDADFVADTALVLSADEITLVRSEPRARQGATFAECWVRKEAYAKLRRTGLTAELPGLTFTPAPIGILDVAFWTARIEDAMVAVATTGTRVPTVKSRSSIQPTVTG